MHKAHLRLLHQQFVIGIFSELFLAGKAPGILGIPSNIMACSCGVIILVVVSLLTKAPNKEKTEFLKV